MSRARRSEELKVMLEAERFVVVAKPAGLTSVPPRSDRMARCVPTVLHALWKAQDPDAPPPVVCHRLDRDTTGCMVLARDRATARLLMERFRRREVQKTYVALVLGAPQPPAGEVVFRIKPDRRRPGSMMAVDKGGKPCHADYETLEAFRGVSLVRVRPRTGRTHEVRVGLRTLGTPCAVDPLYGGEEALYLSHWKRGYRKGRGRPELPLIDRVSLHAESIAFVPPGAPDDAEPVRVEAPLPRDFAATLNQLRRHAAPGSL
jgi:RluA family pseudouridine synthase